MNAHVCSLDLIQFQCTRLQAALAFALDPTQRIGLSKNAAVLLGEGLISPIADISANELGGKVITCVLMCSLNFTLTVLAVSITYDQYSATWMITVFLSLHMHT